MSLIIKEEYTSAKKTMVSLPLRDHLTECARITGQSLAGGQEETYASIHMRGDMGFNKRDSSQGMREGRCEKHFGTRTDMSW